MRDNGHGANIKSNVEVQFGRNEDDACNAFTKELREKKLYYKRAVGVHPGSVNAILKERLKDGKDIPVELFRVYMGRRAKIRR